MNPRDGILSRRARFIAAALAVAGVAATTRSSADAGAGDASTDAGADAATDTGEPQVCLSVAKPDEPTSGCGCDSPGRY